MKISEITRQDIIDAIQVEQIIWSGRMDETAFLSRLYDLTSLPSTDRRFDNAEGDIWQHRINNYDWDDDWVFYDSRFDIKNGDDEILLRFLCETIHPVVRPDITEAERICQLYNQYLRNDGFEIIEKTRLSGKPVFVGRYVGLASAPALNAVKEIVTGIDAGYVSQQITKMEAAVTNDPGLAIGTAKELVETCCKTILDNRGVTYSKNDDLPKLVKLTSKELSLTPDDIPEKTRAISTIKKLLSNLATITQGIAELRNQYGTGHGKSAKFKGLSSRHAKLAVGSASTLAVFLLETHEERESD
ncbi:MAG: abortive infection family protein [Rickettsiales bacterium]